MSTVYILGAGASKHVGYPLASTMGIEMLSWMEKRNDFRYTAEFIREEFGDSPDIENVITELDAHGKSLEAAKRFEDKAEHIPYTSQQIELRKAVPIWFSEIHHNPAPAYSKLAERVQPGDAVVTFNYDDSLERELKRLGKWDIWQGYGFQIGDSGLPTQVAVLKLHGSINWLVSIFGGMTSGSYAIGSDRSLGDCPRIATEPLKFLGYDEMTGTFPDGGGGFPSLILPGRTKEFYYSTSFGPEHREFFDSLWFQAATALRRADKLVLCGYSLLPVDERACMLLLGEPSKNVKVIVISGSQGERISNDFRRAGFREVDRYDGGYFEKWVTEPFTLSSF